MSARQASRSSTTKTAPRNRSHSSAAARPAPKVGPVHEEADEEVADDEGEPLVPDLDEVGASDDPRTQLKEDPVLDRRIIEGMLRDRKVLLEDLAREGMTSAAVLRRAAELGLSEALLRQVKGVAADLAGERPGRRPMPSSLGARTCLSCDRVFLSTGPGNRLCMRCRGGDAGLAQF